MSVTAAALAFMQNGASSSNGSKRASTTEHDNIEVELARNKYLQAEAHLGSVLAELAAAHEKAVKLQKSKKDEAALNSYNQDIERIAHIPEYDRYVRHTAHVLTDQSSTNPSPVSNSPLNSYVPVTRPPSSADPAAAAGGASTPFSPKSIIDELRGRIFTLEQEVRQGAEHKENLKDAKRVIDRLQSQFHSLLLETMAKKRATEEKKRQYNTLLKALAFKCFFRERQHRAKLVTIVERLMSTLNELEQKRWERQKKFSGRPNSMPLSLTHSGASSTKLLKEGDKSSTGSKRSRRKASVMSGTASSGMRQRSRSRSRSHSRKPSTITNSLPTSPTAQPYATSHSPSASISSLALLNGSPSASGTASGGAASPNSNNNGEFEAFLLEDEITVRSEEDFRQIRLARKHFLDTVIRVPKQKVTVLIESLSEDVLSKVEVELKKMNNESQHAEALATTHLQSVIELSTEKTTFETRENELKQANEKLASQLEQERAQSNRLNARILELQHEAHVSAARKASDEARQIELESKTVSMLVDRSHTLRRKVRDSEAVLAALEKKKMRLQRQGFTTGVQPGGVGSSGGIPSQRGIGGGGLGLLTMAMMQARDQLQQTHMALQSASSTMSFASLPPTEGGVASPTAATSDDSNHQLAPLAIDDPSQASQVSFSPSQTSLGSQTEREREREHSPQAQESHTGRRPRRTRSSSKSPSRRLGSPFASTASLTNRDAPMVTQATIGRLQLTLPIVPLYAPAPPSESTRPTILLPQGSSIGYAGVTGMGVSSGLRVGQRLDRRLGDFERIAVEQIAAGRGGGGDHESRGSRRARAQTMGSSTGSMAASAYIGTHHQNKYASTAYKSAHLPTPRPHTTFPSPRAQNPQHQQQPQQPFFAGNESHHRRRTASAVSGEHPSEKRTYVLKGGRAARDNLRSSNGSVDVSTEKLSSQQQQLQQPRRASQPSESGDEKEEVVEIVDESTNRGGSQPSNPAIAQQEEDASYEV